MSGPYDIGTLVQMAAQFSAPGGSPADPTDVVLYVKPPSGPTQQYTFSGAQVQKNGVGNFFYNLLANISGTWTYKFQGTGAVEVTTPDETFLVNKSVLISG